MTFSCTNSHYKQPTTTSLQRNVLKVPGKVTPSKLWLKQFPNVKFCRLFGKVTCSKLRLKRCPKVKFRRLLGKVTCSKLWLKRSPIVKFCRLLGKVTSSKLWSNRSPKVKLCRLLGKVTCSKLWLKWYPKVNFCRLWGKVIPSKLRSNLTPNVKFRRLFGKVTSDKLWLKIDPNVKFYRLSGKITPSKLWLNLSPKVKFCRLLGKITPSKLRSNSYPKVKLIRLLGRWKRPTWDAVVKCVTPSKESSASEVSSPFKKHHAACNWVGTNVQHKIAVSASARPCSCKVWCNFNLTVSSICSEVWCFMWSKTSLAPLLAGKWFETIFRTSEPSVDLSTRNLHSSPVKVRTSRLIIPWSLSWLCPTG